MLRDRVRRPVPEHAETVGGPFRHEHGAAAHISQDCAIAAPSGLWRNEAFVKLLSAHTVSQLGSQVTLVALPMTAIGLQASAAEMGMLRALEYLPLLLIGLLAGVWVDRMPRRPLLIGSDLGRAVLMAALPLAALLGILRLELLYIVAFLAGALTVLFDVALQSYVPSIVHRAHLIDANAKLEVGTSIGFTAGPGLGGLLTGLVGAPFAIVIDALSFLASAALISKTSTTETDLRPRHTGSTLRSDVLEGLRFILHDRLLRPLASCSATMNLCNSALLAVLFLYAANELGLAGAPLGIVIMSDGVGAIIGASLSSRAAARFGVGPTMLVAAILPSVGTLLAVIADPSAPIPTLVLLAASQFLLGLAPAIYNITSMSVRQALSPDHLRGRISASGRVLIWGTLPMGSLLGGALGDLIGLRFTLVVLAAGFLLASGWVVLTPLAKLRRAPAVD